MANVSDFIENWVHFLINFIINLIQVQFKFPDLKLRAQILFNWRLFFNLNNNSHTKTIVEQKINFAR